MTVKVSLIAAVAENGVIGNAQSGHEHSLPWSIKSEFRYFRDTTMGKPLIFGRKTLETLGKPLPGRQNIIVTRDTGYKVEGAIVVNTVEDSLKIARDIAERSGLDEVFVGGGAEIYRLSLPHADRLYITEIHLKPKGDTLFPDFDRSAWNEVKREFHKAKEGESADYTITVLERKHYPLQPIDANGVVIAAGDKVLFKKAPEALLSGLPLEDQEAIKAQEGKLMEIVGFDDYGHVEMEFTSADEGMHTIWVKPDALFKA